MSLTKQDKDILSVIAPSNNKAEDIISTSPSKTKALEEARRSRRRKQRRNKFSVLLNQRLSQSITRFF